MDKNTGIRKAGADAGPAKVIACMAVTANGFVATPEGGTDWVSSADWENFKNFAKRVGNVIIGRGTYDSMVAEGSFPLPDALNVVMTSSPPQSEPLKNVIFRDSSPEEVLEELKGKFSEILVGGGGELLGSFMADGLLDELYLTVEPAVFGEGIKLFGNGEFDRRLRLLELKKLGEDEVQLHYAVRKD